MTSRFLAAGLSALAVAAVTVSAQMPAHTMNHPAGPAASQSASGVQVAARATAEIKGNGISGTAEFVEYRVPDEDKLNPAGWKFGEVEVTVRVTGLKPGLTACTCTPSARASPTSRRPAATSIQARPVTPTWT